jgi:hypothetical protein
MATFSMLSAPAARAARCALSQRTWSFLLLHGRENLPPQVALHSIPKVDCNEISLAPQKSVADHEWILPRGISNYLKLKQLDSDSMRRHFELPLKVVFEVGVLDGEKVELTCTRTDPNAIHSVPRRADHIITKLSILEKHNIGTFQGRAPLNALPLCCCGEHWET